jgi:hypothetical protein
MFLCLTTGAICSASTFRRPSGFGKGGSTSSPSKPLPREREGLPIRRD